MTPNEYRDMGYQVFPCDGKRPARCRTWPNDVPFRPGDNIGLVIPKNGVLVDCDLKPEIDGVENLKSIAPAGWQPECPIAKTGSGGRHLMFGVSPIFGVGNSPGNLPPGIDIRGGGKGYIIVAPSIHPATGAQYEWTRPLVPPDDLPLIPDWLLRHILPPPKKQRKTKRTLLPGRDLGPYLKKALEDEARRVEQACIGEGNETINKAAFNLGTLSQAGLDYSDAKSAIETALSSWSWNSAKDERAAWRTFESGWNAGTKQPRSIPDNRADRRKPAPQADLRDNKEAKLTSEKDSDRPSIMLGPIEIVANDQAIDALAKRKYPDLFHRNKRLVRVLNGFTKQNGVELSPSAPIIRPLSCATLRERLSDVCWWMRQDSKGELIPAHPPQWAVQAVADRGDYPGLPKLRGIASYPLLRRDGTIASIPGYDEQTGYFLSGLPEGFKPIPNPSQDDAKRAAGNLLDLVQEFPFRSLTDASAWLAYFLTPIARPSIDGPLPFFVISANVQGTGKTLLADVPAYALIGESLVKQSWPGKDDELEKILVSTAILGLPILCFDNVSGALGGAILDKWLTSTTPSGRRLGASDLVQFDWQTMLVATTNNASICGDTDRRSLYVNMRTEHEHPELRTGFKIAHLPTHLKRHRAEILADALCILQAYHLADRPAVDYTPKGSFESWSEVVQRAIIWAGIADPERAPDDPDRPEDRTAQELGMLLSALQDRYQGDWFTVSQILEDCYRELAEDTAIRLRDVLATLDPNRDRPSRQLLGRRLGLYRHRWINDMSLDSERDSHTRVQHWRVSSR